MPAGHLPACDFSLLNKLLMRYILRGLLILFSLVSFFYSQGQESAVQWSFQAKPAGNGQYDLIFTGKIADGFYTYSQFLESSDGPIPTSFTYQEGPHFKLIGKAKEGGEIVKTYDQYFSMNLTKFKHKAVITQRIEAKDPSKPIEGYLTFMACNDEFCQPPKDVDFKFVLPATETSKDTAPEASANTSPTTDTSSPPTQIAPVSPTGPTRTAPDDANFKGWFDSKRPEISIGNITSNCGAEVEEVRSSNFGIFAGGFIGGLLALLTPCVFPMVPMTVSFFVKRSKDRRKGLRNAFVYGASIVLIYLALGIAVTAALGPTALNEMSTDMYFNLLFFAVFVIFSLSFFGLFEITLPSSWVNQSDRMADRGGLIGIFFMAFTLALVSFSCTGPIVGTLLVEAARANAGASLLGFIPVKPAIGMFGFGLALALPFALFAMFPGWLNSLPKSGSWMDNVKITLGIVELALAMKFLSTADLVRHWGILKFETFLAIWLVLALLLGLYQLGLIPWKGNKGRPGIGRATFGLGSLAFAFYLGWGLFNYKSLSLLSGLAPPVHYSYRNDAMKKESGENQDHLGCPHNLNCYHDFDEAVAEAKRQNKPLFVDFTGHGCVNCRKMEETVWDQPGVIEHLRDNYIVVSLYVDDQKRLFPDNKFSYLLDPNTGEKIRTVGDKWAKFQVNNFGRSSQPWYVLMHHDGKTILNQPVGFTPDVKEYSDFLQCGILTFSEVSKGSGMLMGDR